jgi:transposase
MPWKASSVMDERLRFVARLLDGEQMSLVCREFGISRKTGYKIFDRYKAHGLEALTDRSRRPVRYANQLPQQVESLIVRLKAEKPYWGARKIRELLVRRLDTTAMFWSRLVDASACIASGSTSRASWQGKDLASRKSTRAFGSSASCTMISATSIWSRKPCNPSTTRSAPGRHPCLRYVLSPICPGRTRRSWRRGRDSNPRYGYPYAAFRVRCIQPLCHLSGRAARGSI